MYNESVKKAYIKYKINEVIINESLLSSSFEKTSLFEDILQKDLSEFTLQEIMNMYKTLNFDSLDALIVFNSNMNLYTQYCLDRGLVSNNQNIYKEIDPSMLNSCLNQSMIARQIITRSELLLLFNKLLNARDIFIILAVFEFGKGKKNFEDIVNAYLSDIDRKTNTMKLHSGRIVHVSDKLIDIAEESSHAKEYCSLNGRSKGLIDDGTIIKRNINSKSSQEYALGRNVYQSLVRSFDVLGIGQYMTANKLIISGQIQMIKDESNKLNITPKDYLYTHKKEIENQYGTNIVAHNFLLKYSDYF